MVEKSDKSNGTESWAKGIDAITLFVEDLENTKAFYQLVFDLPVFYEDPNSCVFKFGDTLINLLRISEADELITPAKVASRESGSRMVFTVAVDDVDAMCALSLIHISEPTRLGMISYAVFCLKKKN